MEERSDPVKDSLPNPRTCRLCEAGESPNFFRSVRERDAREILKGAEISEPFLSTDYLLNRLQSVERTTREIKSCGPSRNTFVRIL
jgi:hypothetical protein